MKKFWSFFAAFIVALLFDWLTKLWAGNVLTMYAPIPVLGQAFRLTLGYNTGVAFGMFANGGVWPLIVTGIIIVGLATWLIGSIRARELSSTVKWPMALILGGAVANFLDRLPDGRVTDFLDIGFGATRWPTFNFADGFIVLGVALLLWFSLKEKSLVKEEP